MDRSKVLELMELEAVLAEVLREILHLTERQKGLEGLIKKCKEDVYGTPAPVCEAPEAPASEPAPKVGTLTPESDSKPLTCQIIDFLESHKSERFRSGDVRKHFPGNGSVGATLSQLYASQRINRKDGWYFAKDGEVTPIKTRVRGSGIRNPTDQVLIDYVTTHPGQMAGQIINGTDRPGASPRLTNLVRGGVFIREYKDGEQRCGRYFINPAYATPVLVSDPTPKVKTPVQDLLNKVRLSNTPRSSKYTGLTEVAWLFIRYSKEPVTAIQVGRCLKNMGGSMGTAGPTLSRLRRDEESGIVNLNGRYLSKHLTVTGTTHEERIFNLLNSDLKGETVRVEKIAAILGIQKDSCAAVINKLCAAGKVERVTPGSYIIR